MRSSPGVELILEANERYWRKVPSIKSIIFKGVPERATRLAMLKTGEADIAYLMIGDEGTAVDDELLPGEAVGPFAVVDAHGKSPGEIALHWPARRILLIGDACVGKPPGECALLPDAVIEDKPALIESLRRLSRLDFDSLLVGDGAPIMEGGRAVLERLLARVS